MEEDEAAIEFVPEEPGSDGEEAEGVLEMRIPAIPEKGIAPTKIRARGTRAQAARALGRKASALLSSRAVQAVLPPQGRIALAAAKKLGSMLPKKIKRWLPW